MKVVWVQKWEESERGWGTRPDGYSMHAFKVDVKTFAIDYWDSMPDSIPAIYSRPCGYPFVAEVDDRYAEEVNASDNGIRVYDWSPNE